jgi:glycerol-3-phosphate dehydrogenase
MGLLDPSISDEQVIIFLPWQGNTIAGTTDSPALVEVELKSQEEIRWVLEEVRRYLSPDIKVCRGSVLSVWSGLRLVVRNLSAANMEGIGSRNHMIYVGESGMVTIAGDKRTTYRAMAQETVDVAVKTLGLEDKVRSGYVEVGG